MRRLIYLVCLTGFAFTTFVSCEKDVPEVPPPFGVPFPDNPSDTTDENNLTMANTTWVIYQYRIGLLGDEQMCSDTLMFIGADRLSYNLYLTQYRTYYTISGVNITLYDTPWGVISGEVYPYNILQGQINGVAFKNLLNPTTQPVYLWLNILK